MLRTLVMAVDLKKKKRIVKGNRCNPAKNPLTVKLVFSLEYKEGEK